MPDLSLLDEALAKLTVGEIWLFCRLAYLLQKPNTRWTGYPSLAGEMDAQTSQRVLWKGKVRDHTLSRLIAALTDLVNANGGPSRRPKPLVEKREGVLQLTPLGAAVCQKFQVILTNLPGTAGPAASAAAPLKIRVTDTIAAEILPGAVWRFTRDAPNEPPPLFRRMDYAKISDDVHNNIFDLGLGWKVDGPNHSRLKVCPLEEAREIPLVMLTPRGQPFREEEHQHRLFFTVQSDLKLQGIHDFVKGLGLTRCVEVVSFQAVLTHVKRDRGVGVVPLFPWVLDRLRAKGAVEYQELKGVPRQSLMLYLPAGGEEVLGPPARAFVKAVRENTAALFDGGTPPGLHEPGQGP